MVLTHRAKDIAYVKEQLEFFSNLKNPSPRSRRSVAFYTAALQRLLREEEKEMGF